MDCEQKQSACPSFLLDRQVINNELCLNLNYENLSELPQEVIETTSVNKLWLKRNLLKSLVRHRVLCVVSCSRDHLFIWAKYVSQSALTPSGSSFIHFSVRGAYLSRGRPLGVRIGQYVFQSLFAIAKPNYSRSLHCALHAIKLGGIQ